MIKVICLGKLKEKYLIDLVNDYQKRINKYHRFEIIELKEEINLALEAEKIEKYITDKTFVITLEIEGKVLTSEEFAEKMDHIFNYTSDIAFVIGSSCGLDERIKKRSDFALSFSRFTMPHGLFRGVLLEQIYRAFKINHHDSYHK